MCNRLLQSYACGHSKTICTTPCAYALKSTRFPTTSDTSTATVSRSNSTISSLAPAAQENSTTNFSRPNTHHSPLRASANAPSAPTSPPHVPAFRFVAPDSPPSTSPVSPVSPSFPSNNSHPSAPPSRFPSPTPSATTPEPKFCAYYIPRYLRASKYPCIECYCGPEWEGLRGKWMESYRLGHPLESGEGVERLGGVERVMEAARERNLLSKEG